MAEGTRQKSVISGKMYRRVKIAVQPENMQFFVVFVFVDRLQGDLHHNVHNFRSFVAERESQIVQHESSLAPEVGRGAARVISKSRRSFPVNALSQRTSRGRYGGVTNLPRGGSPIPKLRPNIGVEHIGSSPTARPEFRVLQPDHSGSV